MKNLFKGGGMKTTKGMFVLFISLLILTVTSMEACGFLGFGDTAVLLHDGSKIVVKRWYKRGGNHELGQRPGIKEQTLSFTLPGAWREITWKDDYSEDVGRSNFTLVAFHILNSTPYIIATPRSCLAYNKWGRPNPPYVIFKFEGNEWKRIGLPDLPLAFSNINLVITTSGDEEELVSRALVSAEMVKKLNSSLTQDQFKTIVRTSMDQESMGIGCEVMVRKGDGWYSLDGPKAPSSVTPKPVQNN
jgi:hypothetical protein